ncbi:MAG: cobalt-precorrin-5B (C(1))-methyltransferase [Kiloniella sp.]|nr:cobalt-precorrin-5B (C(1))-methyltransferase [Kiloniella sp.]RZO30766.1 MAG: cobalt-precorrin-5B (C(1))-methyltransferase [Rhodospirillaceae bacterium]
MSVSTVPTPKRPEETTALRRGWTTGACAAAASASAFEALSGRGFEDPVTLSLPGGQTPAFVLAHEARSPDLSQPWAEAGIIKDAGDDPDVTHGALVTARLRPGVAGSGLHFEAGEGVGTVTKPGLPIPVGEPSITPGPREQIAAALQARNGGQVPDMIITLSIPGGEVMAQQTLNPRLGVLGGLSILGTTGIVIPYSCSSWIHSIHRGIDVARALGLTHVIGSTGDRSEQAARQLFKASDESLLDMGDFAGGMLKYLARHPVPRVTIAGGIGKLTKLAQGALDLHSGRSQVDIGYLTELIDAHHPGVPVDWSEIDTAAQALLACDTAGLPLGDLVAAKAQQTAQMVLSAESRVDILVFDRSGRLVGRAD